ncbi:putative rRNA methyltransferase [Natrialba magadii ATCC 43099]|uniref:Type 11 methyltransferase n=1 Tax=Natrialba magadii (strain ATCC 43099 / DSM 3394 / CCM 3739 / CIP 104546 / IAM 13178 / JCM 8861 / NBRC 102185 / NCIMB 2190 / MS3) TaxID=547559 RepID=D3SU44_NATMM|nr:METTL5 family protein [Natrialba magadii]ADD07133.1 putative rRNA methyltransferase [Natrialba magadii ATCC 43099]ELY29091.1 type 11 methyltransferase [Natrialba magadii ATCC 43099]
MAGRSRRTLARELESIADFESPSPSLEQYLTPPEIAAHIAHLAGLQDDLERPVVDLGTGTGMLATAAALAGAGQVLGVDLDSDALALARENAARVGVASQTDWIRADVSRQPLPFSFSSARSSQSATVLSNPPFGAQRGNRHADREFLETARSLASVSYTIHNEGSQEFVESYAADEGGTVTHAFRAAFPIERRFEFHTAESEELAAEVFRVEWE